MVDVRGLDPRFCPSTRLSAARFLMYTGQEVEAISCRQITNPNTFNSLLHPNLGGLYDPAMGPCGKHDLCGTCGLNYVHCPGHMGHINLPLPVYHPVFFANLYTLLRISCWNCHRLLCTPYRASLTVAQLQLIEMGLLCEAGALEAEIKAEITADKSSNNGADSEAAVGSDGILRKIQNYIAKCEEREEEEACPQSGGTRRRAPRAKNLMEFRSNVMSEFVKVCSHGVKKCLYCTAPVRSLRQENRTKVFLKPLSAKHAQSWIEAEKGLAKVGLLRSAMDENTGKDEVVSEVQYSSPESLRKQRYLTPLEVREHVQSLWNGQKALVNAIVGCTVMVEEEEEEGRDEGAVAGVVRRRVHEISPADVFFLDVIPVPPSRFRPVAQLGDKKFENPQTVNLQKILNDTIDIEGLKAEKKVSEGEQSQEGEGATAVKKPGKKLTFPERLQISWMRLQMDVNCLMDSSSDKTAKKAAASGIKQILEKKEGLFRKHMMGKRVDFAARSVISPDPYINMDEIGIPMVFATKLTYPQPVTHWNVRELRQAVVNGPNVHPGATHVQNEDGSVVLLSATNSRQRVALAKKLLTPSKDGMLGGATKKVFRHLKNGDVLLMNRQPTLHKPSIMAHKARVLPGEKTLRLHYANCKSYNADFDGDEMNAHFPQNELARSEGYNLVSTHHQYLVPKDGTPLSGLIQDHVVSGLLMTLRGRTFNRSDYMHLIFSSLPHQRSAFRTLTPCIIKPERVWSGKQIVSTLLCNIVPEGQERLNLTSKAKIAIKEWGRTSAKVKRDKKRKKMMAKMKYSEDSMTESEVIFCQGELMCGILDKSQFGSSQYGFVHSCYELYGGAVANLLLSSLGRLFTTFLQLHGFTLGVEDILVKPEADESRHALMAECKETGPEATVEALGMESNEDRDLLCEKYAKAHRSKDPTAVKSLDYFMKKKTDSYNNSINTACVPAGLHKPFPANSLQLMVQSGAKGSTVNCMQISSLLGQIELEGQRPPMMVSGRFLPSFLPYDPSPRAGGFVDGRFLTGIRPQEYFFHCMAGREGLVDTAVKTSRSGYLQRCLIKHLEGICVGYDMSVRDCDGSVVQFLYGEDGMDIAKTRFLTDSQFPFLVDNYQSICYQLDPKSAISAVNSGKATRYQKKVNRWHKKNRLQLADTPPRYRSGFLDIYEKHLPELEVQYPMKGRSSSEHNDKDIMPHRTEAQLQCIDLWYGMSAMARESCWKKFSHRPIPVNAHLSPNRYFGSIPEKMSLRIKHFIEQHPEKFNQEYNSINSSTGVSANMLESLIHFKCLRALAEPGEAVGLLAAQSIGEPSTQMTLNTFHFAGRGEMNVTLGIPRLREILMTASPNIKTPSMDVPLTNGQDNRHQGERLKRLFTRVCLSEVLEKVEVWETIARKGKGKRHRVYKIKFSFLPQEYYQEDFVVTPEMILVHVESVFMKKLISAISREIKMIKQKRENSVSVQKEVELRIPHGNDESAAGPPDPDDEGAELSDEECEDAVSAKLLSKKQQHATYEGPGESDEEAIELNASFTLSGEEDAADDDDDSVMEGRPSMENLEASILQDDNSDEVEDDSEESSLPRKRRHKMDMERVRDVLRTKGGTVVDYSYDAVSSQWCKVTLKVTSLDAKVMLTSVIERTAAKSVVWETPNIKKGFLSESTEPGEEGVWRLKTDGVNLQELWNHGNILDLSRAYTNNIHAMANTYGIEAAGKAIIREISGVFKVYGIAVDYRHLSLIADYMTYEGSYKPFNRIGMESNSSPFQKMSFETTMQFLKSATINGETDPILSPSACLVAGRVVRGGTGCFELMQQLC